MQSETTLNIKASELAIFTGDNYYENRAVKTLHLWRSLFPADYEQAKAEYSLITVPRADSHNIYEILGVESLPKKSESEPDLSKADKIQPDPAIKLRDVEMEIQSESKNVLDSGPLSKIEPMEFFDSTEIGRATEKRIGLDVRKEADTHCAACACCIPETNALIIEKAESASGTQMSTMIQGDSIFTEYIQHQVQMSYGTIHEKFALDWYDTQIAFADLSALPCKANPNESDGRTEGAETRKLIRDGPVMKKPFLQYEMPNMGKIQTYLVGKCDGILSDRSKIVEVKMRTKGCHNAIWAYEQPQVDAYHYLYDCQFIDFVECYMKKAQPVLSSREQQSDSKPIRSVVLSPMKPISGTDQVSQVIHLVTPTGINSVSESPQKQDITDLLNTSAATFHISHSVQSDERWHAIELKFRDWLIVFAGLLFDHSTTSPRYRVFSATSEEQLMEYLFPNAPGKISAIHKTDRSFAAGSDLHRASDRSFAVGSAICEICGKGFNTVRGLAIHKRVHK
jgi:hypothetical protein